MEKFPYIEKPLPQISTRIPWTPFTSRPLPAITARMNRHELLQVIGEETTDWETPVNNPTPAGSDHRVDDNPPVNPDSAVRTEPVVRTEPLESSSNSVDGSPVVGNGQEEKRGSPNKYMKPPGEPNRPHSGGYSLEGHLLEKCEWTKEQFKEVQVQVHELAAQKLDVTLSYRGQNMHTMDRICEEASLEGQGRLVNNLSMDVRPQYGMGGATVIAQADNEPYVWMFSGHDKKASAPPVNPVKCLLDLCSRGRSGRTSECQHARKSALWTISLKEEVEKFVAPSQDTATQVQSWLALNNLTSSALTAVGDWIAVDMAVSQANRLLAAEFSTFQNEETNHTVDRTLSSRGSEQNGFCCKRDGNKPRANPPTASISSDCQVDWTPACLQQLYNIPSEPTQPAPNVLAVSGFSNVFANKHDLKTIGIQYATGLATGVAVSYISTGPLDSDDTLAAFPERANYLVSSATPPQTIVNTFPGLESEVSPQIAESLCNAYAQLAARGISYIVDTGLWGAGGIPFAECISFDPPFPASCPLQHNRPQRGGFSNFFKRLKYQDAAVAAYVKTIGADGSSPFNVSGRAVPDVSAMNGATWIADGTLIDFASTTAFSVNIFAGVVVLLADFVPFHRAAIDCHIERIEQLEDDLDNHYAQLVELREEKEALRQERDQLNRQLEAAASSVVELQGERASFEAMLMRLSTEMSQAAERAPNPTNELLHRAAYPLNSPLQLGHRSFTPNSVGTKWRPTCLGAGHPGSGPRSRSKAMVDMVALTSDINEATVGNED
ncbi:hypothetical protein B0H14DRAFT_2625014 [Mycena olivaceomarginata]|nr:hypothetical protein B0H14DRAFT_2625014 [Mycena olivaceomarginata]